MARACVATVSRVACRSDAFRSPETLSARNYAFGSREVLSARGYAFGSREVLSARGYAFGSREVLAARGYAFGSRTTNRAPATEASSPRRFSALMVPRNASTIWRLMESPRPECWPKRSPCGRSE